MQTLRQSSRILAKRLCRHRWQTPRISGTDLALRMTLQISITFISSAQGRSQLPSMRPGQLDRLGWRWQWVDSNQESALICTELVNRISNAYWHCSQQRWKMLLLPCSHYMHAKHVPGGRRDAVSLPHETTPACHCPSEWYPCCLHAVSCWSVASSDRPHLLVIALQVGSPLCPGKLLQQVGTGQLVHVPVIAAELQATKRTALDMHASGACSRHAF